MAYYWLPGNRLHQPFAQEPARLKKKKRRDTTSQAPGALEAPDSSRLHTRQGRSRRSSNRHACQAYPQKRKGCSTPFDAMESVGLAIGVVNATAQVGDVTVALGKNLGFSY